MAESCPLIEPPQTEKAVTKITLHRVTVPGVTDKNARMPKHIKAGINPWQTQVSTLRGAYEFDVVKPGKAYKLQCNLGAPGCTAENGRYSMVELPENFGVYECTNVEVYRESAVDPEKDKDQRLGAHCLVEK